MTRSLSVLLAVTVAFTLPRFNVAATGCLAGTTPMTDLDSVFVWMQPQGATKPSLAYKASVRGMEGAPLQVSLATSSVATVWVVTKDRSGNLSCDSNLLTVNATTDVQGGPAAKAEWFDVFGRRVRPPVSPGIYMVRRGRGPATRVVVVR